MPSPASSDVAPLRILQRGAVFHIELSQPEARNPLGHDMIAALNAALDEADSGPAVRVLLFTAAGPAFSAGGNLGNLNERLQALPGPDGQDPIAVGNRQYGSFLARLTASPKVSVVAVQGHAVGGGAGLVCAADISIGIASARFGFPETSIGLVPGQILPFVAARIGVQAARRLMLTGERITAAEAHRLGLLDEVVDDAQALASRTRSVVESILACGPVASAATKLLLRQVAGGAGAEAGALTAYLDEASRVFARQMRSEAMEGVSASRAKRKPRWAVPADL
ncbi:MAG: enoyl-CoA hydratase/isomerase family protein [Burkholderiaceae bacterium]